jgi:hypothetical protein
MPKNKLEITEFFQNELRRELDSKLEKIRFISPYKEKPFNVKERYWKRPTFDLWSKKYGKGTPFAIWELEIAQEGFADCNIWKLEGILKWEWEPRIFFFQIFSPRISRSSKSRCNYAVEILKRKYKGKLVYEPIEINIDKIKFERMVASFERNKSHAKSYYGKELRKEARRIARKSVGRLKEI